MPSHLDHYDPVRIMILDDIAQMLTDPGIKHSTHLRLRAMSHISRLREIVRALAPMGSRGYEVAKSKMTPDDLKFVYWEEYSAEQYREIKRRRKSEETAVEWIGA
jgi:hypothetical protein